LSPPEFLREARIAAPKHHCRLDRRPVPPRAGAVSPVPRAPKKPAAAAEPKSKKPARRKAASPAQGFDPPQEPDWHRMISEQAYYRAQQRGFTGDHRLEDWLAAEETVRQIVSPTKAR
jgi:Protein of unknown function (DUF2934)